MPQKKSFSLTTLSPTTDTHGQDFSKESSRIRQIKTLVLKPAGFPLKINGERETVSISTDNIELFQAYAREQWGGLVIKQGDYLFDRCMFPDFAFKVTACKPERGRISLKTRITLDINLLAKVKQESPNVDFSQDIGQEDAKRKCRIILKYLQNPAKFGEWSPRNILFFGPPGTGKTLMARALAGEADVQIFLVKATELLGMHVGEGAGHIHRLYRLAASVAPAIVFIDEIDAIGLDRRYQAIRGDVTEIVNALLSELDGLSANLGVVTITATNAPGLLDGAVESRFEERIEFNFPTEKERLQMLELWTMNFPLKVNVDLKWVAKETNSFSGRDLKERLLKNALHNALLENAKSVEREHFQTVLRGLQRRRLIQEKTLT
ncbi:MAG: AAA family ATPase [Candidatus Ranarchaeia archaeon]